MVVVHVATIQISPNGLNFKTTFFWPNIGKMIGIIMNCWKLPNSSSFNYMCIHELLIIF
jgi:hypothetical protein